MSTKVIEQTDEQKTEMYMKLSKKELVSILIQCNKIIEAMKPRIEVLYSRNGCIYRR
jgi:hypothetical protein